jgi:cytochrome c5
MSRSQGLNLRAFRVSYSLGVREDDEALRDKLNEILAQKQAEIDALLLPEAMMKQEFSLMLGVVSAVSLVVALGVGQQAAAQSSGKQVYYYVCYKCHETGVMDAPKLGDPSAWKSRIKKGKQALYQSAINGIGTMPPKGGSNLPNSQVQAAVDYMLAQVSGGGGGGH